MPKPLAVVLVSGGMDSCITAAIASRQFELAFLHMNYGQRTEARELQSFNDIAEYYGVSRRLVISMEHLAKIGGSSLTDPEIPVAAADLQGKEVPTSYVPFRNANMLAVGVSWAEVIGAEALFIGAVQEDSSGYPDCRREFYEAFNEVIRQGTRPETRIAIQTPVIGMTKREIVLRGVELNAPLHLTWSCYRNERIACGVCDSCALRLRGFQSAGLEDPILYEQRPNYLIT
jgi:7-cyano-7-deazaguanine synthase